MARSNKYASLNFNDIYEKKIINGSTSSPNPSPSFPSSTSSKPSRNIIPNSRIHGHMLVLTRPAAQKPKPVTIPPKQQDPAPKSPETAVVSAKSAKVSDQTGVDPDTISLRPQGRTGSVAPVVLPTLHSQGNLSSPLTSPVGKSDRFVPPHLRPGFVGREEKPGPDFVKGGQGGKGRGQLTSNSRFVEEGRPKSGGGVYDRIKRIGGEPEAVDFMIRPGSSGARPNSSG